MVNKVQLLGYLRKAPELAHTPNGTPYTLLVVETERTWRGADGTDHTETDRIIVQVWRKLAEACCHYLRAHQLVYVEGRLHTREWQDDQQARHSRTEVIAEQVKFLPHFHRPRRTGGGEEENLPNTSERDDG